MPGLPRKRRRSYNDSVNGDAFDISSTGNDTALSDAYSDLMGVDQSDKAAVIDKKLLLKSKVTGKQERSQAKEENNFWGWQRGCVRPPNTMYVKLKYRDQFYRYDKDGVNTDVSFSKYYCNDLYKHNRDSSSTVSTIPLLQNYAGLWNRALVLHAKYTVTFVNLDTQKLRGFIGFEPFGQHYATGTWLTLDQQINSDANRLWARSCAIGPSATPQSQVTLTFGKYLPAMYGDKNQYMKQFDGATLSFNQDLKLGSGLLLAGPTSSSDVDKAITCKIGVMNIANASVTIKCLRSVKATLSTLLYRTRLEFGNVEYTDP